ncbi:SusF/SusE family outer membrane protein [Sphingobacterium phlebotomi]|uniref:SusF/SusE family outer membrane protein n=1 Tax=Sphingobacterium phlebotomi TaxID=2605433 RepID=A0A5D4HBS7_9SPHI|nr:SusF/SusE family outer membrane protein [Sphingobacterium phlebotomi]TYR37782.1 SusF/SusE family outer membrane protein [Sphingobacterium phlebotomi]
MKKIYHILRLCLVLPVIFSACKDDFGNIDYPDGPLVLSVSESDVTLEITAPESDAVTFQWTPGSNFGSNAAIKYTFELALKGTDFEESVHSSYNQGNTEHIYRTAALNTLLMNEFGVAPGDVVELEARVTAEVQADNIEPQISEVVSITIQTYKPVSSTLFLIGSATPNGWSVDNPAQMNAVQGTPGAFVWQGSLMPGEFKFITTEGNFVPSYSRGTDNSSLYFRESEEDPYDEPFHITEAGVYQLKVNLISLAIEIVPTEDAPYSELWLVGGFTDWSFQPMVRDVNDPFVFHYNALLSSNEPADEFKIATLPDFDPSVVFLRPETDGQGAGTDLPVVSWSESENGDDYKWRVPNGTYKIKLDLRENKMDIVPFAPYANIYLVGDAAPNGWDVGNATAMVKGDTPYLFTWTGTLQAGELKFSCDKQTDWNGAWFVAPTDGLEPTGETEQMLFSYPGSNPDNKWMIVTGGTYTITLDQLKHTVIIEKQ